MNILFIIIGFLTFVLSGFYTHIACKHLSEKGKHSKFLLNFFGPFAGKEYFTKEGWKYAVTSILIGIIGLLTLLFLSVFW